MITIRIDMYKEEQKPQDVKQNKNYHLQAGLASRGQLIFDSCEATGVSSSKRSDSETA